MALRTPFWLWVRTLKTERGIVWTWWCHVNTSRLAQSGARVYDSCVIRIFVRGGEVGNGLSFMFQKKSAELELS